MSVTFCPFLLPILLAWQGRGEWAAVGS